MYFKVITLNTKVCRSRSNCDGREAKLMFRNNFHLIGIYSNLHALKKIILTSVPRQCHSKIPTDIYLNLILETDLAWVEFIIPLNLPSTFSGYLWNIVILKNFMENWTFAPPSQSTLDISKLWGLFFAGPNYPKCKLICTSGNLDL